MIFLWDMSHEINTVGDGKSDHQDIMASTVPFSSKPEVDKPELMSKNTF